MDDSDGIILFLIGAVVVALLFFGVTTAIKKSFKNNPQPQGLQSTERIQEQSRRNQRVEEDRKRLMQTMQQRNRDLRRR